MIKNPDRAAGAAASGLQQVHRVDDLIENEEEQKSTEFDLEGMMRRRCRTLNEFCSAIPVGIIAA